jgi:hypothetical protein
MIIEYIYWQKHDGTDGVAPYSSFTKSTANVSAQTQRLKYYFEFPVRITAKHEKWGGVSIYALMLARYFASHKLLGENLVVKRPGCEFKADRVSLDGEFKLLFEFVKSEFEKQYFTNLLKKTNGNVLSASKLSGLHRMTINSRANKFGIETRRRGASSELIG